MITEIVLLLGFLCFLCVRGDYIRRRLAFVAAMLFWGLARLLTELGYGFDATSGSFRYDWGSLSSYIAAACLFFCLFSMFIACTPRFFTAGKLSEDGVAQEQDAPSEASDPRTASERIRELVDENEDVSTSNE